MGPNTTTRDRILYQGLELISQAGLSGLSLGKLAQEASLSKSGLFAHFHSKEQLERELLNYTVDFAQTKVVEPAMQFPEGLPRLEALVNNWLGWTTRAGLPGGCPIAAAAFELDDSEGPIREEFLKKEKDWREFLKHLVLQTMGKGHFRMDLDADRFVWELCGIYLVHHVSFRFVRDPNSDRYAKEAFQSLIKRSLPDLQIKTSF
ncbi:TetR family transcriptional regulator [Leptospira kobayashii]|uniref:TetR family transcriptional regulator n=1 Tax=Leptospira kobayashii TaxID=1917830 RepID=A0ABM7URP5_9LEPT|nr:TetR/AcrR family transcriptional regulator [Leptospira kobayashii]BDA79002.1 TetR family transcriptional regulator [Leptospira kobayashii]